MGLFDTGVGETLSGIGGLVSSLYNLYTNKRDFDYQKALQQQIFEREDTAVQRRMADLEAAGINPNLAAGSAAGAGSVVARSNTNDVNFGAALDNMAAARQIQNQKQQTENLKKESKVLDMQFWKTKFEADNQEDNWLKSRMNTLSLLGIPYRGIVDSNGVPSIKINDTDLNKYFKTNFQTLFNYNMDQQKNSAALLQKDIDYYNMDKAFQYVSKFMPDVNFGIKYGIK